MGNETAATATTGRPAAVISPQFTRGIEKLGMALFIAAETMFFAGLISAYLVFRAGNPDWPPAGQPRLPVASTAFNTLILLLSAFFCHRAVGTRRNGHPKSSAYWLGLTGVFGLFFLVLQGREWIRLVQFGLTLTSSVYGALFYLIVGIHGLHVLAGVAVLFFVLKRSANGRYPADSHLAVELARTYWTFVVGLWPVLYVLVYLL